jgi:cytochrome c biogenesis protein CcmG/thiol:disulfide interchange protein DsbE
MLPGVALLAAAALLALLAFGVSHQGTNSSIDNAVAHSHYPAVPDSHLELPVLGSSGKESLAAFRGRVVVLNVFASWCQPCATEAPILERLQRYLAGHGGTVLGVTYLDTSTDSLQFAHQWHLSYPIVRDVNGTLVHSLGTNAVPETFVVDRRGRIVALRRFQLDSAWVLHTLSAVLAERS